MDKQNFRSDVKIGKRSVNSPNHWQELDLETLKFEMPTVICLSGNGTITTKEGNSFAKQAQRNLDLLLKTKTRNTLDYVDVIGVKYAECTGYMKGTGVLTDSAVEQISDAILKLLVDVNGNKLILDQAKKNMSRVSFFTYCAGHNELQNIIKRLNKKLLRSGYTQKEIDAINHATLEVSFAPLGCINKIPSVQIISLKDSFVGLEAMLSLEETLTDEQVQSLNGIHLHQDQPGKFYGIKNPESTAVSFQIISTNLLNAYYNRFNPFEYLEEHYISLIARDQDWNLEPVCIGKERYQSGNADCVSQMMAWALCKGVENSVQNFNSQTYVPNTYLKDFMSDFKSILNSFDKDKVTENAKREVEKRKQNFEKLREAKQFDIAKHLKINPSQIMVERDLRQAKKFEDVMMICERYDYDHIDKFLPKLKFLKTDERLAIEVAKENKQRQKKYNANTADKKELTYQQLLEDLQACPKDFKAILLVLDRYAYRWVDDIPALKKYLNNKQFKMVNLIKEIKEIVVYDKLQFVQVPSFEAVVNKLNHADSLEDVIDYIKQNDFLGVEYVLPEVQVLTEAEKNHILAMVGKKQKTVMPQEIKLEK